MRATAALIAIVCFANFSAQAKHKHYRHHSHHHPVHRHIVALPGDGLMSFNGTPQQTASGTRWNPQAMTAAHRTLPFGTHVRVSRGQRSVTVTVTDRGPFRRGRVIDVTPAAFRQLGPLDAGLLPVKIEIASVMATDTPSSQEGVAPYTAQDGARPKPLTPRPSEPSPSPIDAYLCEVYARTPTKIDSSGDFTWKDKAAAKRRNLDLCGYVIGGINQKFRSILYQAGLKMDAAGIRWSILSGFRDDYRQRIADGFKARGGNSQHGGSRATKGYGDGRAIDITAEAGQDIHAVLHFIDRVGRTLGLYRPMPGADPMHVQCRLDGEPVKVASHKQHHRHIHIAARRHHRRHVRV